MNLKGKAHPARADEKDVPRNRPAKEGRNILSSSDSRKGVPVGNRGGESQPSVTPAARGSLAQQSTRTHNLNAWVKGDSSLSFLDVARGKNEVAVATLKLEPEPEAQAEAVKFLNEDNTVAVVEDDVDSPPEVSVEEPVTMVPPSNDVERLYVPLQEDVPVRPLEEIEQVPPVKYYVLEIDRIFEESTMLPSRITTLASGNLGLFTFSGQPGEPPAQLGVPTHQSQHFYRPEAEASARIFSNSMGVSDINRSGQWNSHATPGVDVTAMTWRLQETNSRPFQGMLYNSYVPPAQAQQRSYGPSTVNRTRQHDLNEYPFRATHDSTPLNRHPTGGGGVW